MSAQDISYYLVLLYVAGLIIGLYYIYFKQRSTSLVGEVKNEYLFNLSIRVVLWPIYGVLNVFRLYDQICMQMYVARSPHTHRR